MTLEDFNPPCAPGHSGAPDACRPLAVAEARVTSLSRLLGLAAIPAASLWGAVEVCQWASRFAAAHAFPLMVLGAALSFTTGGIFMKASEGLTRPLPTTLLIGLFVLGACLQTLAMRGQELGVTYIVVLGIEAILAFWFGSLLFDEQVTPLKLGGVLAIVAGIIALRH